MPDRVGPSSVHPDADVMLIERLLERDERALGDLYDRHHRLVFGLVMRILGNQAEAEEVLQEVFLSVWTRAGTFDAALGSPAGWLVGIARNRALDRLRSNHSRSRTLESASGDAAPTATPEQEAAVLEQQRTVSAALDSLDRAQRLLIEDAYFLGLTHAELAERHGLPLGTVKTRIRAGMLALRQHLAQAYVQQ